MAILSTHLLPDWDCNTCTARMKVQRGCETPTKLKIEIEGQPVVECPKRLFLHQGADINELMWYYSNFKRGVLPVEGGLLDQPGLMMELFAICDSAVNTIEQAMNDKAEKTRKADAARAARQAGRS